MAEANALAYSDTAAINVKSFIAQAPGELTVSPLSYHKINNNARKEWLSRIN